MGPGFGPISLIPEFLLHSTVSQVIAERELACNSENLSSVILAFSLKLEHSNLCVVEKKIRLTMVEFQLSLN